jgi:hypothetical protein
MASDRSLLVTESISCSRVNRISQWAEIPSMSSCRARRRSMTTDSDVPRLISQSIKQRNRFWPTTEATLNEDIKAGVWRCFSGRSERSKSLKAVCPDNLGKLWETNFREGRSGPWSAWKYAPHTDDRCSVLNSGSGRRGRTLRSAFPELASSHLTGFGCPAWSASPPRISAIL